ncbi:hypothetical protein, partial [Microcoleus sp. PH2017_08_TRC_O_A]|uniref:hypothetical protein n=1 Tax=Microcoleus sp. PH2017_08_TRC_O_A TaxID=2798819 RepID=UPI0025F7CECF
MMGNYHVPFWRAVEGATPSLTLIILRKVASKLGLDLNQLGRRCLTTVARVRLWVLPKPTLSAESQRMKDLRVSR